MIIWSSRAEDKKDDLTNESLARMQRYEEEDNGWIEVENGDEDTMRQWWRRMSRRIYDWEEEEKKEEKEEKKEEGKNEEKKEEDE